MTDARPMDDHIDSETLAAFIDGTLAAPDRARVEAHLAECEECFEVWTEAGRDEQAATAQHPTELPVSRMPRWSKVAALLAASVVAGVWLWPLLLRDPATVAERELIEAVGTARFSVARLSIAFPWGPAPSPLRGEEDGLSDVTVHAASAAATLAERQPTALSLRVAGAGQMVRGRHDAAVRTMESAVELAPEDPLVLMDLGVTLLERFRLQHRYEDAVNALEAIEAAHRRLPNESVVLFNRALALEATGRLEEAVKAWDDYLRTEDTPEWAVEARARRADVLARIGGQPLATLDGFEKAHLDQLALEQPWLLLDFIDRVAVPRWTSGVAAGASPSLDRAIAAAEALAGAGRDRYPQQLLRKLAELPAHRRQTAATALELLARSRTEFEASRYADSRMTASRAALELASHGLPKEEAEMQADYALYFSGEREIAVASAGSRRTEVRRIGYLRIAARIDYISGQYEAGLVDIATAITTLERAANTYERAGDQAQAAASRSQLMLVTKSAGLTEDSWRHLAASVRGLPATSTTRLRYLVLSNAQFGLLEAGLLESATSLGAYLETIAAELENPAISADLQLLQIGLYGRLKDVPRVRRSAEAARGAARLLSDHVARARNEHAIDLAVATALHHVRPLEALDALERVLNPTRPTHRSDDMSLELAQALLLRGQANARLGKRRMAELDWMAGIEALEAEHDTLEDPDLVASRVDRLWDLYASLIDLYRHDPDRSLQIAERPRSLTLRRATAKIPSHSVSTETSWLPADVLVLAYTVTDDSLFLWTISKPEGVTLDVRSLPRQRLVRLIDRFTDALRNGKHDDAAQLVSGLVLPRSIPANTRRLIVIPDGAIHRIPFAALRTTDGRILLNQFEISASPSLSWLKEQLERVRHNVRHTPLLIGFGGAQPKRGLPQLPDVSTEIAAIATVYADSAVTLIGPKATPDALRVALRDHDVVHIAGHAYADDYRPADTRLFLAPGSDGRDSLTLDQIRRLPLSRGTIVILSACSTAHGRIHRGEGVMSVAKAFLTAGASAVVASLWPVRDMPAAATMVALHREMQAGADIVTALARVQRSEHALRATAWEPWMVLGAPSKEDGQVWQN